VSNSIERLKKIQNNSNPYPRDFPGRETIQYVLNRPSTVTLHEILTREKVDVPSDNFCKIAGRISARRHHGETIFFDLFDQTGSIQLIYGPIESGKLDFAKSQIVLDSVIKCDLGDMVGVEGALGQNPRGKPLLLISNFTLLAKALREPPDKRNGLKSPEHKYRHREQDLMSSADSREVFKKRAEIVFEIRKYLNERDFVEIETPILQPIYGGATAKPFTTQHNTLGQQFFLSISSELYLKRALVGGFDRVYAFSRCFRNEGISPEHNPEFTNLEIFESCKTDLDMICFTEDLIRNVSCSIKCPHEYPMIFDADLPSSDWPLSRKSIGKGRHRNRAEAWELYIDDMEIASGASDLNDPHEQETRLKEPESKKFFTNEFGENIREYDPYDQNYIEALEMGALPWAGVGIGIDRLCMLLLGKKNIRDVIMFPLLKTKV
jgi:lysyl-tRNA synthetase class II